MSRKEWNQLLKKYAQADHHKVAWQLINTLIPYVAMLFGIFYFASQGTSFLILIGPTIIAAGLMVRLFIFFHDCTHGSFVATAKGNDFFGNLLSLFVFTPYVQWKIEHSIHHSTVGNLDERGIGDIWTMTVGEYEASSKPKRFIYRLFRHPAFLFTIAPVFKFVVLNRLPKVRRGSKEVKNYWHLNIALGLYSALMIYLFGWQGFLLYQLLIVAMASSGGLWLFYVQHQFEEVYWADEDEWDLVEAALKGSTYYKLPAVLEWFTGYIGYHHIHHLNARIPNYHLQTCYKEIIELQHIKTVTLGESFKLATLALYDEKRHQLMTYAEYARLKNSGSFT